MFVTSMVEKPEPPPGPVETVDDAAAAAADVINVVVTPIAGDPEDGSNTDDVGRGPTGMAGI